MMSSHFCVVSAPGLPAATANRERRAASLKPSLTRREYGPRFLTACKNVGQLDVRKRENGAIASPQADDGLLSSMCVSVSVCVGVNTFCCGGR